MAQVPPGPPLHGRTENQVWPLFALTRSLGTVKSVELMQHEVRRVLTAGKEGRCRKSIQQSPDIEASGRQSQI